MKKTVITVVGKDTVGIIAKVCTYLANNRINILDISQTILSGFFNMMMVVDMGESSKPFDDVANELTQIGEEIGVVIHCQREEYLAVYLSIFFQKLIKDFPFDD